MFNAVSNWWGNSEKDGERTETGEGEKQAENQEKPDEVKTIDDSTDQADKPDAIDEAAEKALNAAKQWGSYLLNVGKKATKTVTSTVTETAKQIKHTVEERSLLGDFSKEQDKFVNENREKSRHSEAAVPPWVGYNEEEAMKTQILALSEDKRNFLRNPPSGVKYQFDYGTSFPVATVLLSEDENLRVMRFELVPKQTPPSGKMYILPPPLQFVSLWHACVKWSISEENFWRNYFYRVSLIKQSAQLNSLAQTGTEPTAEDSSSSSPASSSKGDSEYDKLSDAQDELNTDLIEANKPLHQTHRGKDDDQILAESPPNDSEFISDTFAGDIDEEDLRKEMQQLGMKDTENTQNTQTEGDDENIPEWERELQAELNEYEVVVGDTNDNVTDADLEREILEQIEAEEQNEAPKQSG